MDLPQTLKRVFPPRIWHQLRLLKITTDDWLRPLRKARFGGQEQFCPVCGSGVKRFLENRICPICFAKDRHRFAYLVLERETDLLSNPERRFLHVAPEPEFSKRMARSHGSRYLTADLYNPTVDLLTDIRDIPCPDDFFDGIYCSHVLEHVENDHRAMREFFRILKPGGFATIQVPITSDTTFEDPSITDPKDRLKHYGQLDHVIAYGPDFSERLAECGFLVASFLAKEYLDPEERNNMDIDGNERVFLGRKPGGLPNRRKLAASSG